MLVHQWCFSQSSCHRHWLRPIRCRCLAIGNTWCSAATVSSSVGRLLQRRLRRRSYCITQSWYHQPRLRSRWCRCLAIGQHVGSSFATRLRSRRVVLNKPPSKTLDYAQGAEDARRALALKPSEPRLHCRTLARPALAEHSSLHKPLPPFSSQAGHLSLPPVGVELPWAASPHKGKRSVERSVARAIGSGCFCCCFSSFCLTVGLCSRPARHIALQKWSPDLETTCTEDAT